MRILPLFSLVVCVLLFTGCHPSESSLFTFMPPSTTGITFVNRLNEFQLNIVQYLYYYNGGGVAVADINQDGMEDLFFTGNEVGHFLYLNKGNFTFEDISDKAGVNQNRGGWSTGVTICDVNMDGLVDFYVCQVGDYKGVKGHNLLYVNQGDLTFAEQSSDYGLDFVGFSTQALFFDYDRDGDQDIYLLNHSVHQVGNYGPASLRFETDPKAGDRLFERIEENGRISFRDVTGRAGILSSAIGYGLGVVATDVNNDGWLDIYVSNDFHEIDYLYLNNGNKTFSESSSSWLGHTSRYSMGVDAADLNLDGFPEIMTLDMLPADPRIVQKSATEDTQEVSDIKMAFGYGPQNVRNTLQLNRQSFFQDIGQWAGMEATDWSWSCLMADLDNDRSHEVLITNGIFKRPNDLDYINYQASNLHKDRQLADELLIEKMPTLKISNYCFKAQGDFKYKDVANEWGLGEKSYSSGATYADLDNDGDLDLIVNNVNMTAFVYRNESSGRGNSQYLNIRLESSHCKLGLSSSVTVFSANEVFLRENIVTRGFLSSVSPRLHIGLGNKAADSIYVRWSNGDQEVFFGKGTGDVLLRQGGGAPIHKNASVVQKRKWEIVGLPFRHREDSNFRDIDRQPLIPYLLSREGPALAVGDVNGDGLEDVFFGGAHGQAGMLLVQGRQGFMPTKQSKAFQDDAGFEDVDAIFFDADQDGDNDLLVVSGGNMVDETSILLTARLYVNTGAAEFVRSRKFPSIRVNASCVRAADIDGDGDQDVFLGARSVAGKYGQTPASYLLRNDGNENFSILQRLEIGMVTDARWFHHKNIPYPDLVVVGDWMPVCIFRLSAGLLHRLDVPGLGDTEGWWRTVAVADMNMDGVQDFLLGNLGGNTKLQPTGQLPVELWRGDFDRNGNSEAILFYPQQNHLIPLFAKQQMAKVLPPINRRFSSNEIFARNKGPADVLGVADSSIFRKNIMRISQSGILMSGDSGYLFRPFAWQAQLSCINGIEKYNDLNLVLLAGNTNSNVIALGSLDSFGLQVFDLRSGYSEVIEPFSRSVVRRISRIQTTNGGGWIVALQNGQAYFLYQAD